MVYVLFGTGFEEMEAITPVDLLRRAGISVLTVGLGGTVIRGSHGIPVQTDISIEQMDLTDLDMIVLPGGLGGVASIQADSRALDAVRFAWENGKYVAAICAAPSILAALGITQGKNATCYPGIEEKMPGAHIHADVPALRDGRLITGASAGCAVEFSLMLIAALKNPGSAADVAEQIVIRHTKED